MPITRTQRYTEYALLGVLGLAPIFALTVRGWTTLTLVLASLLSLALLMLGRKSHGNLNQNQQEPSIKSNANFWVWLLIITFASQVLAVLISQSLRHDWVWKAYDAPMRFLVAIPIFLCIYKRDIPVIKVWKWSFPLMAVSTFLMLPFMSRSAWYESTDRLSTYFVDPLTFGHVTLTFGVLCMFIFNNKETESLAWKILKLLGITAGIYLSIKSGSRTGWIATPFILFLWLLDLHNKKINIKKLLLAVSFTFLILFTTYKLSSTVSDRIKLAFNEIAHYSLNKENPYNSVGARISMAREGFYFFKMSPWSGWGDQGYKEHINDPSISLFADPVVRNIPLTAGFHNEFTNNAVHYGIWGLLSVCLTFFAPIGLFITAYFKKKNTKIALIGMAYLFCELASAMSTEVWNLKYTAALSSLLIASFCGSILGSYRR